MNRRTRSTKRTKWTPTHFGLSLDFPIPDGCDVVVLCKDAHQIAPLHVCLPHQIYKADLKRLAKEHGTKLFYIIPYRSTDVIEVKAP